MELKLAGNVKNNRKGFYRYITHKIESKESISPLINEKGELETTGMEKAEVLKGFFDSKQKCSWTEGQYPGQTDLVGVHLVHRKEVGNR